MTEETNHDEPLFINTMQIHGLDECIKTGLWFTVPGSNTGLYTGDLFYNMGTKRFRISGIPCGLIGFRHAVKESEPGPFKIDLYVKEVLSSGLPVNGYATIEFQLALASGEFMAWMEEWWNGRSAMAAATRLWEVSHGVLAWQR